jgi:hypothetical protein
MTHRITGDTLAISDSVAMTPTTQPAAAGTQRSRDFGWLSGRYAVRVTDGEDIRSCYGMPMQGRLRIARVGYPNDGRPSRPAPASVAGIPAIASSLVNSHPRPSPVKTRDSKWRPTPTVSHMTMSRLNGPVTGTLIVSVLRCAGGFCRDRSAPGPAQQGFFADGVISRCWLQADLGGGGLEANQPSNEAGPASLGRPHQH